MDARSTKAIDSGRVRSMTLRVGDKAPDFDVISSDGRALKLSELRGRKNVVLYFYPADFTLVCTRETCGFRDMYDDLAGRDTEVIGVSTDSDDSHRKFASKHTVPFPLVADPKRELADAYEARGLLTSLLGKVKRVTYVIDKTGTVRGVFEGALSASKHVDGVRELVRTLADR
jgi:peroxiredoxin Q/BCP